MSKNSGNASISGPFGLAEGIILAGPTAPAYRAAVVLISRANSSGVFDITKPELEKLAGLRLDATDRFLERLRVSQVACTGDIAVAFDEIEYVPGVQNRLAGIIRGRLSPALLMELHSPRWSGRRLDLNASELSKLTTVPGILLWLRLAVERQGAATSDFRLRLREEEAAALFGPYIGRAAIKRRTKSDGEFQWTSLSRIYEQLIAPAVKDLWSAIDGHVVDARPGAVERGHGKAWSHVEITMQRLAPMPSLRELNMQEIERQDYAVRKHRPRDPAAPKEPAVDP